MHLPKKSAPPCQIRIDLPHVETPNKLIYELQSLNLSVSFDHYQC